MPTVTRSGHITIGVGANSIASPYAPGWSVYFPWRGNCIHTLACLAAARRRSVIDSTLAEIVGNQMVVFTCPESRQCDTDVAAAILLV